MRLTWLRVGAMAGAMAMSFLAGCGGTTTGTVAGTFETVGGPPGHPAVPVRGTVVLSTGPGRGITVKVGASGHFAVQVPVDTYRATGRTPAVNSGRELCSANAPVTVRSDQEAHVTVSCQIR